MDYLTLHAPSIDSAREQAAQFYAVDLEHIECVEIPKEILPQLPTPVASEAGESTQAEGEPAAESVAEVADVAEVTDVAAPESGAPIASPPPPDLSNLPLFKARVRPRFWEEQARSWVLGMTKAFGILAEVRVQTIGTQVFVRLSCPEPSILIGKQGHTLEALQHIVTRALTTKWNRFPEVIVDVESYKEKKLQRLVKEARGAAQRAVRSGRSQELEPMTASERKYIHNALKDFRSVRTISHGKEPNRHVVVEPLDPTPRGDSRDEPSQRPFREDRREDRRGDRRGDRRDDRRYGDGPGRRSQQAPAGAPQAVTNGADHAPADESIDWKPTIFRPPDLSTHDPAEPYPEVEDDLHG